MALKLCLLVSAALVVVLNAGAATQVAAAPPGAVISDSLEYVARVPASAGIVEGKFDTVGKRDWPRDPQGRAVWLLQELPAGDLAPLASAAQRRAARLIALHPEEWRAALQRDHDHGEPTVGGGSDVA